MHYITPSKLRPTTIQFRGIKTQTSFTTWSWNLLGLSFLFSGLIPLFVACGMEDFVVRDNPWMLRLAILAFETAAPFTMLVAFVVRYAIWPETLSSTGTSEGLRGTRALLQHNANVIMALTEVGLLGGLPVRPADFAVAPLFGIAYVLFSWYMIKRWSIEKDCGPQFYYFFLDTTLGGMTPSIVLLILLSVLVVFYGLFCMADYVLGHLGGGLVGHVVGIAIMASLVCRFRD